MADRENENGVEYEEKGRVETNEEEEKFKNFDRSINNNNETL